MKKIVFFIFFAITVSACNNFSSDNGKQEKLDIISTKNITDKVELPVVNYPDIPDLGVNDSDVGTIKGSFNVDHTGQAVYTIPINLPPGTAGLVPQIAIEYKHRSANNYLGVGFSLKGISIITRVGQTWDQDGRKINVMYQDTDRFALDGKRLIAISGEYGQDGTEYRTEIDSFARIVSYGRQGNGPKYFKVWTQDGKIYEYGLTEDSRIEVSANNTVRLWSVNKIMDRNDNYILYKYYENNITYECNPSEISYTGNEKQTIVPNKRIQFFYTDRSDYQAVKYKNGSHTKLTKLLNKIETYADNSLTRKYTLEYQYGESNRPQIKSIKECNGNGTCLPPTEFKWTWKRFKPEWEEGKDHGNFYYIDYDDTGTESEGYTFIDLNGDSRSDYVYSFYQLRDNINQSSKGAFINTGNDFSSNSNYHLPFYTSSEYMKTTGSKFIDFNGDGLIDFLWNWKHNWSSTVPPDPEFGPSSSFGAVKNTGYGWQDDYTFTPPRTLAEHIGSHTGSSRLSDYGFRFVDLNGDSLVDIIYGMYHEDSSPKFIRGAYLNTGQGWSQEKVEEYAPPYPFSLRFCFDAGARLVDVNGDGLVDFVYATINGANGAFESKVYLNTGQGWATEPSPEFELPAPICYLKNGLQSLHENNDNYLGAVFIDINNDGLRDFIYNYYESINNNYIMDYHNSNKLNRGAYINTGNGWTRVSSYETNHPIAGKGIYVFERTFSDFGNNYRIMKRGDLGLRFIDVNGDGYIDFIKHFKYHMGNYSYEDRILYTSKSTFLNKGDRWSCISLENINTPFKWHRTDWQVSRYADHICDLDGDGLKDIVQIEGMTNCSVLYYPPDYFNFTRNTRFYSNPSIKEHIEEISNGYKSKIKITYKPHIHEDNNNLSVAKAKYTKSLYIVDSVDVDNGNSGYNTYKYSYGKVRINKQRGAFLGFGWKSVHNVQSESNIRQNTYYYQEFPYIGRIKEQVTGTPIDHDDFESIRILSRIVYNYDTIKTYNDKIHFPYIKKSIVQQNKLSDHSLYITSTTTSQYDNYGNVTDQTTTITADEKTHTTKMHNHYYNDAETWLTGLVTHSTIEKTNEHGTQTKETSFDYDYANGHLTSAELNKNTDSELTMNFTYDSFGHVISSSLSGNDIDTRTVSVVYDSDGRFPVKYINPLGFTTLVQYDERFGTIRSITDQNGQSLFYEYDGFGRLGAFMDYDGTVTRYYYNWETDIENAVYSITEVNPAKGDTKTCYDALNRPVRNETEGFDGTAVFRDTVYDVLGRITSQSRPFYENDPSINWYHYRYDILDRLVKETAPDNSETTLSYNGLETTTTDAKSNRTVHVHDGMGNLVSVIDALNSKTEYRYDALGNILKTIDAKGNSTIFTYDKLSRPTAMDDPDMGHYEYEYNSLGQLIRQKNGRNEITEYRYDLLNRKTEQKEPEGTSCWLYDASVNGIGKIHKVTGPGGYAKQYYYDSLSRPTGTDTTIDETTFIHRLEYDNYSRIEKELYPSSLIVKYHYNSQGYVYKISDDTTGNNYWSINHMTAHDHISEEQFGNGIVSQSGYDTMGRLNSIKTGSGLVQDLLYEFDKTGNLTKRFDVLQQLNEIFDYDSLNRLTISAIDDQATKDYQYDEIGNVLSMTGVGTYQYNSSRPHAVTKAGDKTLQYDGNGNAVQIGEILIEYSSFDKPLRIENNESITTFTYGPDYNRIKQVSEENAISTTKYYTEKYEKVVKQGATEHINYIYGGSKRVAIVKHDCDGGCSVHYLHNDHLGSTDAVTDETGSVAERHSFAPFGHPREGNWIDTENHEFQSQILPYGFTGHEHVTGGLIHMNGRIYDPVIGRFLSADPVVQSLRDPQSLNPYSYVLNNPLILIDPNGYELVHFIDENNGWKRQVELHPQVVILGSRENNDVEVEIASKDSYDYNNGSGVDEDLSFANNPNNNSHFYDPYDNTTVFDDQQDDDPYLGFVTLPGGGTIMGRFNVKPKSPGALQTGAKIAALTLVTASTASPLPEDTITIPVAVRLMAYATVGVVTARELAYNLHNAIQKAQQAYSERIVKARENVLTSEESEDDTVDNGQEKEKTRSKHKIGKRVRKKSKKDAREAAQKAGKGKKPKHDPDGEYGPHYHPDVRMPKNPGPKTPSPHDHYYYPRGK